MSNLLTILIDGFNVAKAHWGLLLGTLLILAASQLILYAALRWMFGDQLISEEYYSLSIAGWLLPASFLSFLWYLLGAVLSPRISLAIVILIYLATLTLFLLIPGTKTNSSKWTVFLLVLIAVLFILLRLVFVSKAILPMYFDSAQHYLFTKVILTSLEQHNVAGSFFAFYHLGFHFLAALITFITRGQINNTMLILGQVILAVMPFSTFFIIRHWTRSSTAGIFAVVLAAFGWYMPAHVMDWGKYPALAGIALLPFVLSIAYLSVQNRTTLSARKYRNLNAILLAGILITGFLHSRTLVVFGIVLLSWIITLLWQKLKKSLQLSILGISILALFAEIAFIQVKGILGPLFDPYALKGLLITGVILLLSIFAFLINPRLVFFCIVSVFLLLSSIFVPLGSLIPGIANATLLDRPFVEVILYLPLSVLGGFGLAGLEQKLQGRKIASQSIPFEWSTLISILFIALIAVNAFFKYNLYPSDCCYLASQDDLTAIEWMDKNLPQDARILISSTDLNVLPTSGYQGSAGGDAGIWITPLINRPTTLMPFNTDFSQQQTLDKICQSQVGYVYVGKTGAAFNDSGMNPDAYQLLFSLPKAKVYNVTGCG